MGPWGTPHQPALRLRPPLFQQIFKEGTPCARSGFERGSADWKTLVRRRGSPGPFRGPAPSPLWLQFPWRWSVPISVAKGRWQSGEGERAHRLINLVERLQWASGEAEDAAGCSHLGVRRNAVCGRRETRMRRALRGLLEPGACRSPRR